MPTVLIHEEVAYNIAQKYKELDNSNFYLGTLAPDAINLHGFAPKEARWTAHVRSYDLDIWLENVKEFYKVNKENYDKNFLLGYVLHIITDIVHDKYFYWNLRKEMAEDNIKDSEQHLLLRDCMFEYESLNENNGFRIYIKDLLKNQEGYNIQNITKEDMIAWKNHCFKNYQKKNVPNKYITKEHIIELTNKVEEVFKVFII